MPITVEQRAGRVRILFDGLLHVSFWRADLVGIYSWRDTDADHYWIEYTLKKGVITTEYDGREKFETILRGLEALRL